MKASLLTVGLLALAANFAFAGPEGLPDYSKGKNPIVEVPTACEPRWYFSINSGADIDTGATDLVHGFTRNFISESFVNVPTTAVIQSRDWNNVYDNAWRIEGELGYVLTSHLELFGLFRYEHAQAPDRTTGSHVILSFFLSDDIPISSKFDDYNSYGGELGARYFFLPKQAKLRPYISISGGVTHVNAIGIRTTADLSQFGDSAEAPVYKGGFFDDSLVWNAGGMLGLEYRAECHWSIGVEAGVRYESQLDQNDRDFKGFTGFDGIPIGVPLAPFRRANDDVGDRLVCPVMGYLKFRF
jgi:hypothetical protein